MTEKYPEFSKYWESRQLIGKPVFDHKGQDCGKIQSLFIDPLTFTLSGMIVKKRFAKEYFLSRTYFDNIKESGLYLNSIPIKPNDKVANTSGKVIGKVVRIHLHSDTNKLESLEIKSGFKSEKISSDKIVGVGERITIKT